MAEFYTSGSSDAAPAAEPARRSWLKRLTAALGGAALAVPAAARAASPEHALGGTAYIDEVYIGEIIMFAGNYAPQGFALCNGQLLPIAQNTALFSVIGTRYGGNGSSTFALPNLQGHTPIGQGSGPGLTPRNIGSRDGSETVTLTSTALPAHVHGAQVSAATATSSTPAANLPAVPVATNASGEAVPVLNRAATPNDLAATTTVSPTGSNTPTSVVSPYLPISYCIALQGIFPPRS